jgi:hypothetical protein
MKPAVRALAATAILMTIACAGHQTGNGQPQRPVPRKVRRTTRCIGVGETRNRAAERPDKVKELSDMWQQWNRQLAKPSWAP